MEIQTCQLYPPLFLCRKLEKWSLLSPTACMQQYCTFFLFPLSNSFHSIFSLSVSKFFLFSFLSFFYRFFNRKLYIFSTTALPSQLMQQNNSFLFIFLMFISFVLLFCFLFLSFFFYFPFSLQSLISIYLFSGTQYIFKNKLFVHNLEWVMLNVYCVKWFYFLYMLTCLACVYMFIKINLRCKCICSHVKLSVCN